MIAVPVTGRHLPDPTRRLVVRCSLAIICLSSPAVWLLISVTLGHIAGNATYVRHQQNIDARSIPQSYPANCGRCPDYRDASIACCVVNP